MEGFGLPALEALALGCRVVASDIPVFHEILGEYVTYVDTKSSQEIAKVLRKISKSSYNRQTFRQEVSLFICRYNWTSMADKTRAVYRQSFDHEAS